MSIKNKNRITYEGKVRVELYHGTKLYKTIESHNAGTAELFNFLANCLAGLYADAQRPYYLRAYSAVIENGEISGDKTEITTTAIPARKVTPQSRNANEAQTVFEFLIPAATLATGNANVLELYNSEYKNNRDKPSANVILETPISKSSGTSNVKVVWTLIVGNK